jgi:hypothetical protein
VIYDAKKISYTSLLLLERRLTSTDRSDSDSILVDPAAARNDSSMNPLSVRACWNEWRIVVRVNRISKCC